LAVSAVDDRREGRDVITSARAAGAFARDDLGALGHGAVSLVCGRRLV